MSGVRFTVTKTEESPVVGESSPDGPAYGSGAAESTNKTDTAEVPQVRIVDIDGKDGM